VTAMMAEVGEGGISPETLHVDDRRAETRERVHKAGRISEGAWPGAGMGMHMRSPRCGCVWTVRVIEPNDMNLFRSNASACQSMGEMWNGGGNAPRGRRKGLCQVDGPHLKRGLPNPQCKEDVVRKSPALGPWNKRLEAHLRSWNSGFIRIGKEKAGLTQLKGYPLKINR